MPEGGKLTIETRNVELDENYANRHMTVKSGNYVMLAVSDNGIGMDEKIQSQIFEPFFTTKKKGKGTGLGLSTVYGIVTQSGGYIWVYSEPGHGSTIKIYLPRVTEGIQPKKSTILQENNLAGTETILLVEDDERVRKMIYFVLQTQGYKVIEAENGMKALELSNNFDGSIDMMVTDVVMPEMSGLELAKVIKEIRSDIVVLYMSGYTDNSIIHHQDLKLGINFLEKPFSANLLSNKVREMLDK
jgi:CheY-like chemotaxis protein